MSGDETNDNILYIFYESTPSLRHYEFTIEFYCYEVVIIPRSCRYIKV